MTASITGTEDKFRLCYEKDKGVWAGKECFTESKEFKEVKAKAIFSPGYSCTVSQDFIPTIGSAHYTSILTRCQGTYSTEYVHDKEMQNAAAQKTQQQQRFFEMDLALRELIFDVHALSLFRTFDIPCSLDQRLLNNLYKSS